MASPFDPVDFESWLAGSTESARVAVPLVLDAVSPRSVVDVGCGLGAWLAVFKEHGVADVLGYDGPWVDRSKLLVAAGEFQVADVAEPLASTRRFDLALCLEVAQLLEERHAAQLVESLVVARRRRRLRRRNPGPGRHPPRQPAVAPLLGQAVRRARVPRVRSVPGRALGAGRREVVVRAEHGLLRDPAALERLPALAAARCSDAPLPLVHPGCLESCAEALEAAQAPRRQGASGAAARPKRERSL